MTNLLRAGSCCVVSLAFVSAVGAADKWETTLMNLNDDSANTPNILRHGSVQVDHDLEGPAASPDMDWMTFRVKSGHSYEARVSSDVVYWAPDCGSPPCPRFDRVNAAGSVLTAGVASNDDVGGFELGPGSATVDFGMTIRWISTVDAKEFVRTRGDELINLGAGTLYRVEFFDTTYFVPRWNNTATQTTVFIVQNTTNATVNGNILLHNGAGILILSQPFVAPQFSVVVFSTATVPALAGQSGSARVVHNGGYGALAGKAVALEPATGFTFDTPMTPLPR